jgi:hypothetical protein
MILNQREEITITLVSHGYCNKSLYLLVAMCPAIFLYFFFLLKFIAIPFSNTISGSKVSGIGKLREKNLIVPYCPFHDLF